MTIEEAAALLAQTIRTIEDAGLEISPSDYGGSGFMQIYNPSTPKHWVTAWQEPETPRKPDSGEGCAIGLLATNQQPTQKGQ